ncbi:Tyrosine recombinase XerD [Segatella oris]|uniref:Tyrosine recombinase XerD n=1 Tax=Segatella oris TaxID=28135 RepID=A0A3S4UMU4_9BACT|nr:Tyrosine recombinase XerD [Segatella oris]
MMGRYDEPLDSLVFQPHCSRSVMGKNLCIVGKACGIRQRLSYHVARHTFGTMSLSAGIPIESIAKMMGHASISSTQIYAQVTDKKISEDMDRLITKQSIIKGTNTERGLMNLRVLQLVKWRKQHEGYQ